MQEFVLHCIALSEEYAWLEQAFQKELMARQRDVHIVESAKKAI